MAFGLLIFVISAGLAVWQLALRSDRQWEYRDRLRPSHDRAFIGFLLFATSWLALFGTFLLGATSAEPVRGRELALAIGGWILGVVCGVAGLRWRRGDPKRADLASLVFLWGAFAIDPYAREVFTWTVTLIVGGFIIAVGLAVRFVRWHRRSAQS